MPQREFIKPLDGLTKRSKSGKDIIITPIGNLSITTNPMLPDMKNHINLNTTTYHNDYFINKNGYKHLPYHFLVTRASPNRWSISVGAPTSCKSQFLSNADFNGLIPDFLSNSILIAIQDNFNINTPDPIMYEMIAYKVIQPIFELMGKKSDIFDSIHFIDEIFRFDRYDEVYKSGNVEKMFGRLSNDNFVFDVKPSKTFDRVTMSLAMRKYF